MKNIDDKLLQLYKEINRREKLKIHLDHLEQVITTKQAEKDNLLQILAKEEKDVLDLEKESLYNLFSRILGTREKQLEKERQEYLHAMMMFRASQSTLNSLVQEKDMLYKSLRGTQNAEKEYERLMAKKEKLLEAEGLPRELVRLNERIVTFNAQVQEIERAVKKGNAAKKKLIKIIHNLKRIESGGFKEEIITRVVCWAKQDSFKMTSILPTTYFRYMRTNYMIFRDILVRISTDKSSILRHL